MPTPSNILKHRREAILRIVEAHHGRNPRVFGSVVRNSDRPDSDLDILVDVLPGTGLFSLGAMQFELQQTLGIPVDVSMLKDLPARFRDSVVREAQPL